MTSLAAGLSTTTSGHKKIKGRKRFLAVDTLGLLWFIRVVSAGVQEHVGGGLLLIALLRLCPRLKLIWADSAYGKCWLPWLASALGVVLEIVRGKPDQKGFTVQAHRWIVERTFGWWGRYRRLSKDYETEVSSSEAMILLTMIHLMLRRLA